MLPRLCSVLLTVSLAACVAPTESAPDDSAPVASPSHPDAGPPYWVDDGYRDPCIVGETIVIQGHTVQVPVPCAADEIDKGDPLPLEIDGLDRGDPDPIDVARDLRDRERVGQSR